MAAISAGFQHSLALKADGTLVAWGNAQYLASVPAGLSNVANIASGDYHSLAVSLVNLSPIAFSRSIIGVTNSDLVIPLGGWDQNGDSLAMRVTAPSKNGALYQFTTSGRGDSITASNTEVADAAHRVIFSPAPDSFAAPYTTFSFVANDGQDDSTLGLITVSIIPPPFIQKAGFLQNTNPGFSLSFAGFSNLTYYAQASTNLVNWSWLGTAAQPSPGQFFFIDTGWTNYPRRFYRLTCP